MIEPYKPIYTVKEAANILKVNTNYIYELFRNGKLPYLKIGNKKIRGSDLERFIQNYHSEIGGNENG